LTWAVLECTEHTSLNNFGSGILVEEDRDDYFNDWFLRAKGEVHFLSEACIFRAYHKDNFRQHRDHRDHLLGEFPNRQGRLVY
jgi:hypothetical protein